MKRIKNFEINEIPIWKIVAVATSDPDYEMDRTIFVEHYPDYGDYCIIKGFHCSCYSFDDTDWEATQYTRQQLIKLAKSWLGHEYGFDSEKLIAPLIIRQVND